MTTRYALTAGSLICLLLVAGGCTDSTVRVNLTIIDELEADGRNLIRHVILALPSGAEGEQVLSQVLVQAQREGWRASAEPGAQESTYRGAVMSAEKRFRTSDNRHSGTFTTLFGPYYSPRHGEGHHRLTGYIYATGIRQAIYWEAIRQAQIRGYATDRVEVSFAYPVTWIITCPGTHITASRGVVEENDGPTRVVARMYESEFLSQVPLTVHWREPVATSTLLWPALRTVGAVILVGLLIGLIGALYHGISRRRRVAARMQARAMSDVNKLLKRIDRAYLAAKQADQERPWGGGELAQTLDDLREAAGRLADEIGRVRSTASNTDRPRLEWEIKQMRREIEASDCEELRVDLEGLLDARERLLKIVADSEALERRHLLRLSRIETTLYTLEMTMLTQDGRLADEGADREAIEDLQRELEATDAAIEELRSINRSDPFSPSD